jgi:carbonic anhydrase
MSGLTGGEFDLLARSSVSRRNVLRQAGAGVGLTLAGAALAGCASSQTAPAPAPAASDSALPRPSGDPLALLKEGNKRFVAGTMQHPNQDAARRGAIAAAQDPLAAVFCCIDSRISPVIVFDRGLGDLFEIRVAAQDYDSLIEGSVEYGPFAQHTPLIVVMGHQRCGAVTATVTALESDTMPAANIDKIVTSIQPAYNAAKAANPTADRDALIDATVRQQTALTVAALHEDPLLKADVDTKKLTIAGAYLSLDTGVVSWL